MVVATGSLTCRATHHILGARRARQPPFSFLSVYEHLYTLSSVEMVTLQLLALGAAFIVGSAAIVLFKQGRRDIFLRRLHFHRRRASGSNTPPRSLSPGKRQLEDIQNPDYSDIFPPSRRQALGEIPGLASKLGKTTEQLVASPEKKECVPLTTELCDASKSMYTPCEFSVQEIEALGDFPDYATLSGVPLPQPYKEFDIKKAKPRPYRPFRWAYHQTMCE